MWRGRTLVPPRLRQPVPVRAVRVRLRSGRRAAYSLLGPAGVPASETRHRDRWWERSVHPMNVRSLRSRRRTCTTYFAGPWVGEFGWELCCWQGWLRRRAHLGDRIIASSRPGHEALYEDFAIDFVPFVPPPGEANCYWRDGVAADSFSYLVPKGTKWLNPSAGVHYRFKYGCPYVPNQSYIRFGQEAPAIEFEVVIHARDRRG